jgi:hypothetical protein
MACWSNLTELAGRDGEDRFDAFGIADGNLHVRLFAESGLWIDRFSFDEHALDAVEGWRSELRQNAMKPLDNGAIQVSPKPIAVVFGKGPASSLQEVHQTFIGTPNPLRAKRSC